MMVDLQDHQFEYDGVVFGLHLPLATEAEGFDPGVNTFNVQDAENAYNDSISMGRDSVAPSPWSWELFTTMDETHEALEAVADLGRVWNDIKLRRTPGAVKPLRYRIDGRTRVIFGRPRPFGQTLSNKMLHGEIPLDIEFQPADTLHYDDEVRRFVMTTQAAVSGGFDVPFDVPLTLSSSAPSLGSVPIFGGDAPTPFEATFTGGTDPKLYTSQWEIGLEAELLPGESVTVSTYPWGIRALRNDGARVAGLLTMRTRLNQARLDPAGEQVRFSAIDSSGTAQCEIAWRPAHTTI